MIALDISRSMMAEDIIQDYSRLDIAKLSVGKLLNELREIMWDCCFCR